MRAACNKTRYETRAIAEKAISAMARRFGPFTFKRPYRCARCRAYHITSTPPVKGRRRKW